MQYFAEVVADDIVAEPMIADPDVNADVSKRYTHDDSSAFYGGVKK
jgi:aconitase B